MVATVDELLEKTQSYLPGDRPQLMEEAYRFAEECHRGQLRKTGDPYITHPLDTAATVAELQLDASAVAAALIHDVQEDCGVSNAEVTKRFGREVAHLVDGATKLEKIAWKAPEEAVRDRAAQAENLRKMFLAMARDVRVVIIKLADRLHNMRTLYALSPEKQRLVAQETMEIYAPLASRLGIWQISRELEDLSFRYLDEERYRQIANLLASSRAAREKYIIAGRDHPAQGAGQERHPRRGAGPRQAPLQHQPEDGEVRRRRARRSTRSTTCWPCACSSRPKPTATGRWASSTTSGGRFPASSTTTSPIPRKASTGRCTRPCSAWARGRWRCRSARTTCTDSRSTASRRTGATRRAASATIASRSAWPGCGSCWSGSARWPPPTTSWSWSRPISSRTRSSSTRRRARSRTCPSARRPSTSPTAFTPTSATAASARGSTDGSSRSTISFRTATSSKS